MKEAILACRELLALCWRQSAGKLVASVVLKLGAAAALPLSAAGLGALTDAALAGDSSRAAIAGAVTACLVIAAITMAHFAHVFYFELGEVNLLTKERQLIELANGSVGLNHHERPEYADKMQVLRQEVERVGYASMEALLSAASTALSLIITGVLLARLDLLLLMLPLTALPAVYLGGRAQALQAAGREAAAEPTRRARHLFSVATEAGTAKEIRTAGLANELTFRHRTLFESATRVMWAAEVKAARLRILGQLCFAFGYVSAILIVVSAAAAGGPSVGDVILVLSVAALANYQVTAAVALLQDLQRVARVLADVRWLEHLIAPLPAAALPAGERPAAPQRINHGIRLRDVSFAYLQTGPPALEGVDILLPAGSTVAVVGENGAGKSTIVKLLCRFYEPTEGVIEVDGTDLASLSPPEWRRRIAGAFQDFVRFEFIARESVGVGDLPRVGSDDAVLGALRRARSESVLNRLEHGLGTQLGKSYADGAELSRGQWQKLALGRAMMREDPLLLILDEPTADLDAESEHLLFERYAANARRLAETSGTITILVSHRFSTVRMADLILVVVDGRVADSGSHEELMERGGLYADLYGLQQRSYQ
ncbi:ABC transporter ATP-binding protein [Micromonospora craniellae]|uniref:ABC transporter ATP-binding protein n=1 Tax=Micromonospora craniellae TaxID=2294034 RepID=A0A372FRP6_9ACTN|nr:ABC transporter ATP-binding protein [Micromonospora craniellae]QOC93466.1 ABC transporter ATP-binding protein [Micromonospora craniellae]RFS43457.1 ABC transporter ATP-binding protein [Micromonospora craniellae]